MNAKYILTSFSPAMFGEGATIHIKIIAVEEARQYVDEKTAVVATRVSHERLAKAQFPGASDETARYTEMKPGTVAIHLHYRGPQVPDSGQMPAGGMVTTYLLEVEEYQQVEG